jgi:hypothetical protein
MDDRLLQRRQVLGYDHLDTSQFAFNFAAESRALDEYEQASHLGRLDAGEVPGLASLGR